MTNFEQAIRDLEAKRDALQRAIDGLRGIQQGALPLKGRRGRKPGSFSHAERAEVSKRMRAYWAGRRAKNRGAA